MQPSLPERPLVSPADLAACRQMIRDGSKTFYTASLLLPQRVCDASRSLYAFCRVADDAVDQSADSGAAVSQLPQPADRAFADVVARFAIPREIPEALIEGFAWDAASRPYETLSDLQAYAVRVAGTVGAMMSLVMQVRSPQALARACDLGIAMQFTNIARDVGEDARNGRLYLPRQWMREEGLDPDSFLGTPYFSRSLAKVIARLLAESDRLYARSLTGIAVLPAACQPSIHAARLLYAEIGDSIGSRAVVRSSRKLVLLGSALAASLSRPAASLAPAVPEAQFLVDAVQSAGQAEQPPRNFDERAQWLTELFTRIARQRT